MIRDNEKITTIAVSEKNKATLNFIKGTQNFKTFDEALTYLINQNKDFEHDAIELHG